MIVIVIHCPLVLQAYIDVQAVVLMMMKVMMIGDDIVCD